MKLDHCNRSSCAQIIEALRAELEELTQERDELDREFGGEHRLYLTCKYELAATNAKVEELTHCYAIECANHKSSRDQLAAMTKERDIGKEMLGRMMGEFAEMRDLKESSDMAAKLSAKSKDYAWEDYRKLKEGLAAMTKERDELRNVFLTDSVASLASQFAAKDAVIERLREALDWSIHHLEKHHDCKHVNGTFPDMRLWLEQALAIPNDSSALEARLAQEREKIRAEMINEAWSKTGEERSMK